MLDWDDLQSFLAVARHGSLSGAARALGVQQTTMGRRLAGLEEQAGVRLLQKTPRGYTLTAAGEAILGNVERIEGETLAIERRITGRDARLEGIVRVTMVETLAISVVVPALPVLRRLHPGIVLDIVAGSRVMSLTMREADIALRFGRLRQNDLAVRKLADVGFGVYAAPGYLAAQGEPGAGGEGHALVVYEPDLVVLPEVAWLHAMLPQARTVVRTNSRSAQVAAVAAGLGIACLARYLADPAGLVRVAVADRPPSRELWMAVHNDIRHTPRIRAVTDFLVLTVKEAAGRLNPGG
jgi:DNA-binding transcriptional LysR family regulator